jgi:hypothetical protein
MPCRRYRLERVSAGEHTLHAHKEHYVFAPRALQISPNAPTLPELRPERYQVCGRLVVVPAQPRDVRLTSPALELLAYVPSRERPPIDARTHAHAHTPTVSQAYRPRGAILLRGAAGNLRHSSGRLRR